MSLDPSTVYEPLANITKIEHRAEDTSEFFEIAGETQVAGWSRQVTNLRLSKGNPIRFNICWYDDNGLYDTSPMGSYKVEKAYKNIGKTGEYRYWVHVDGRDVAPTLARLNVKWQTRGDPVITLEPISPN